MGGAGSFEWGLYPLMSSFPMSIAAGSAHATYELTLYLLNAIMAPEATCPKVVLSIHVDDISQSAVPDTGQEVVQILTASAGL